MSPTHPLPPSRVILHTQKSGLVWVECTHTIPTGSDLILLGKSHYFPSWWALWSTHIIMCDNLCWVISVECFAEIGSSWQTKFHPVRVLMVKGTVSQRWFQSLRPEVISEFETRGDFRVWDQRWFQSLRPDVISEFETWVTHSSCAMSALSIYTHIAEEEHQLRRGMIVGDDVIPKLPTWVWT